MRRLLLFSGLLLLSLLATSVSQADKLNSQAPSSAPERFARSEGVNEVRLRRVPPPPMVNGDSIETASSVPFIINFSPGGANCNPWPTQAMAAVTFAAQIWGSLINARQDIHIDACWATSIPNPTGNTLANAKPANRYQNFASAPRANTLYPVALANDLSDSDLNEDNPEIQANFDSSDPWYFGTDGNTPTNRFDLVTLALHEIGHGLGFSSSANWDDGVTNTNNPVECSGTFGIGCLNSPPFIYDQFVQNSSGQNLVIAFTNNSTALGNQLVSNNLFFNGAYTRAANGGVAAQLFAPAPWVSGSSISHLDENTFNPTLSSLMTPQFGQGESIHHPGPVALGIMKDIGWLIPNFSHVYVDHNNTGYEDGSIFRPFNTITEGVSAVDNFGMVWIAAGTYPEAVTARRVMTLQSLNGTVRIGQ